jgi:hypothetical protein
MSAVRALQTRRAELRPAVNERALPVGAALHASYALRSLGELGEQLNGVPVRHPWSRRRRP